MRNIVKRFPLVLANDHVNFGVEWGEVHALIGENGAGKSTLMKILYGMQPPDEGSISVDGQEVVLASAKDAIGRGIGMVHQHFMLVETLSVAENLVLGAEPHIGPSLNYRVARRKTRELIDRFGFDIDPDSKISELPLGLQQQVEILKTLYRDARILIMDEPTAALGPQETAQVGELIKQLKAEGIGIFLISHDIHDVFDLADRVSVMKNGALVGSGNVTDLTKDEVLGMIILGKCPPGAVPGPGAMV